MVGGVIAAGRRGEKRCFIDNAYLFNDDMLVLHYCLCSCIICHRLKARFAQTLAAAKHPTCIDGMSFH
uniref:Uncharacterized protein n=1 Tax=Pyxicephalus adspersus TaxID=30357 RepID=A0AAV3AZ86_PYXAD|nr:TPA: hypothetical protein GDO54_001891 [Pyxicephalus adspersus]